MFSKTTKSFVLLGILVLGGWFWHHQSNTHATKHSYISIQSFKEADFSKCDNNTLTLFDMDDTLISAVAPLPFLSSKRHLSVRFKAMMTHPSLLIKSYKNQYWGTVLAEAKRVLIEPEIVSIIAQLHKQNAVVMGLTALPSGSLGQISDLPRWRYNMLETMGVTFSQKFPDMKFSNLKGQPVLYKGMICTGSAKKGDVLKEFLNETKWKPKQIIFFDDCSDYLQSVGDTCYKASIPCQLYHYQGNQKFSHIWDEAKAMKQLDILIKTGKYCTF